jgi:hypothetical protein
MKRLILILITLSFIYPIISIGVDTDSIGIIYDNEGHLHFREGLNGAHPIISCLHADGLQYYNDSTNPHIDSIKFYRHASDCPMTGLLNGKVDIVSIAGDTRIDTRKHSMIYNVSIYCIGYEVLNKSYFIVKPYWEKIKFNIIPSKNLLGLIYADNSTDSNFRYYVTNDPFNSNTNLRNWYWNTKQKAGATDSIYADSIEDAKFRDGVYYVRVKAFDIDSNNVTKDIKVVVANFRPKAKITIPFKGQNNVYLNQKIYIAFSENMNKSVDLKSAINISPGVSGSWQWTGYNMVEFIPYPAFVRNTVYTVTLSDELKDLQNQELVPYTFSFTTGSSKRYYTYRTTFQWEDISDWDVSINWSE